MEILGRGLVKVGHLTPEQARQSPYRHKLSRVLGLGMEPEADRIEEVLETGDRLLLCSDGLYEMVDEDEIQRVLAEERDAEATCTCLVAMANEAGGTDNISVVVVDLFEP